MKGLFSTLFILFSLTSLQAQEESIKKINIDIGISDYGEIFSYGNIQGLYTINLEYKPIKYIGIGSQFSYGGLKFKSVVVGNDDLKVANTFSYALTGKFYISPFFQKSDSKFDIYLKGKIGGFNVYPITDDYTRKNYLDYGAYLGIKYSPIKRIAIFGEVGPGKYSYSLLGLSIKLF